MLLSYEEATKLFAEFETPKTSPSAKSFTLSCILDGSPFPVKSIFPNKGIWVVL